MKVATIMGIRRKLSGNLMAITPLVALLLLPEVVQSQGQLGSDTLHLKEVEIYGRSISVIPESTLKLEEWRHLPVRDIGDLLRNENNVSAIRKGGIALDPVVRGFRYNQVSVLLNSGVKVEGGCPNRMDPVASHVESEDVGDIEIIRGPYLLTYGPVMGALINIRNTPLNFFKKPAIHGRAIFGFETNWNGQREHVELTGGNRFVSIRAAGGYKLYGGYRSGKGEYFSTGFTKYYANATVGFRLSEKDRIDASFQYNQGIDVKYPALPMDGRNDLTHIGTIQYERNNKSRDLRNFTLLAFYSSVSHRMDNYDRPTARTMKAETTVDADDMGGKAACRFSFGKHQLTTGLDIEHIFKDGDKMMSMNMIMNGDTFLSVKHVSVFNKSNWTNAGLYGSYQIPMSKTLLQASLRLDYNLAGSADTFRLVRDGIAYFDETESSFFNISASLGLKWQVTESFFLTAAAGLGTRSPSILERFVKLMPVQYDNYDYLGNPQLNPEQNYQLDLGGTIRMKRAGTISVQGFFSFVQHYITGKVLPPSVIKPSTQGVYGVKQFTNIDHTYLYGFEATYSSPTDYRWQLHLDAAATYGTNPSAVDYEVSQGQVVGESVIKDDPLPEIPPLEGRLQFGYSFFREKLIPKISVRAVAGQYRVSDAFEEADTPGFVTASASLTYRPCNYFTIAAGCENLLNNNYYEHLNRRVVGTSQNLYEPGLVFYVNLEVRF